MRRVMKWMMVIMMALCLLVALAYGAYLKRDTVAVWLGLAEALDYAGVRRVLRRWQPYAGLVYFHLLLDRLAGAARLSGVGGRLRSEAAALPA